MKNKLITPRLYVNHSEIKYFSKKKLINWIINISVIYFLNFTVTFLYKLGYKKEITMIEIILKINTPTLILFITCLNIFFITIYKLKLPFFEKQKITNLPWPWEQKKEDWHKQLKKMVFTYIINFFIVVLGGQILLSRFYKCRTDNESYPGFFETWIGCFLFMISEDFYFYWIHRFLHSPYIYQYIHKQHHKYYNLIYLNSVDSHPFEFFLGNFFTTLTGMFAFGPTFHFVTFTVFGLLRIIEGTETHCGYEFNFSMFKIYPFEIQNSYHNYHHIKNIGNYCIFFTFWDDLFGTNKHFYETLKKRNKKNPLSTALY